MVTVTLDKMSKQAQDDIFTAIWTYLVSAGVLSFSMSIIKAAILGIVSTCAGLLVKHYYYKWFKNDGIN